MRKLTAFLACLAFVAPVPLFAQDENPAVTETIRQLRANAAQMKGLVPDSDIAEMLSSADELEHANRDGAFAVPAAGEQRPTIVAHMEQEHGARYEWLMREAACAGYQWENWRTYDMTTGDRLAERNALCKRAFALFEEYFYLARDLAPGAYQKLEAFDIAAHTAVDFDAAR